MNSLPSFSSFGLRKLSNAELISATVTCAQKERETTLTLIAHLEEIESRMLYSELGYGSTWEFCVKHLKLSEGATGRRIAAMRLVREIPQVKESIQKGTLTLSNAATLQNFFREERKLEGKPRPTPEKIALIQQVEGLSKRETEQTLMAIRPEALPQERERVISPDATELKMVISECFRGKILRLKELLARSHPYASHAEILEVAADRLIAQLERPVPQRAPRPKKGSSPQTAPITQTTSTPPPAKRTEIVLSESFTSMHQSKPNLKEKPTQPQTATQAQFSSLTFQSRSSHIRKTVAPSLRSWLFRRAHYRCEFLSRSGLRCTSRYALQVDHVILVSQGGTNAPSNLRVLCANHNRAEAVRVLGLKKMRSFILTSAKN